MASKFVAGQKVRVISKDVCELVGNELVYLHGMEFVVLEPVEDTCVFGPGIRAMLYGEVGIFQDHELEAV